MVNSRRPCTVGGASIGVDLETTSLTSRYGENALLEGNRRPPMTSTIDPADAEVRYLSDTTEGLPERLDPTQPYREIGPAGHAFVVVQGEAVYMWDELDMRYTLGARISTERPAEGCQFREITLDQLTQAQETAELRAASAPGWPDRMAYDLDDRFDAVAELGLGRPRPEGRGRDGLYPHQRDVVLEIRAEERHTYESRLEQLSDIYGGGTRRSSRMQSMQGMFGAGSLGGALGMAFDGAGIYGRAPRRGKGAYDMNPWPATHSAVSEESERAVTSKAEAKRLRRAERNKRLAGGAA